MFACTTGLRLLQALPSQQLYLSLIPHVAHALYQACEQVTGTNCVSSCATGGVRTQCLRAICCASQGGTSAQRNGKHPSVVTGQDHAGAPPNPGCRIALLKAARKSRSDKLDVTVQPSIHEAASRTPRIHRSCEDSVDTPGVCVSLVERAFKPAPWGCTPVSMYNALELCVAAPVRAQCSRNACCKLIDSAASWKRNVQTPCDCRKD